MNATLQEAIALLERGNARAAALHLEALCELDPDGAQGWFTRGVAHHLLGRLEAALDAFDRALALEPDHLDALGARAAILQLAGRPREARACYERLLALAPRHAQALTNLGIVLEDLAQPEEALRRYGEALDADPMHYPARLNRSALLVRLQRVHEALDETERLVRLHPEHADAHFNRAEVLLALDRYADAAAAAEQALALSPAHVGAQIDRAVALACLGWFEQALRGFELARATDPAGFRRCLEAAWRRGDSARANWPQGPDRPPDPRAIYLARGAARLAVCDWRGRDAFLARFAEIVRAGEARGAPVCEWSLPFAATWLPLAEDVRAAVARAVGQEIERRTAAARLAPPRRRRGANAPLRIGYLTPDVRDHPNVSLTAPLLARHDRSRVAVYAYALNPRDEGEMASWFRSSCDHVRECHAMADVAIARRIRDDGIDILVDLAGYTDMARPEIAALRPAPINCSYLGNPGSTGAAWMDYRITDPVSTPPCAQRHWRERFALLPRTMFCYGDVAVAPAAPDRAAAGLPERAVVFCCFHSVNKIDPVIFDVWSSLLRRVPGSVLWLLGAGAAADNLRGAAAARGVDPARLIFAPRLERKSDHLARQRLADLFLDTPCYNAHTTAVEALYVGLPVLTCPAPGPASRVGASIVLAAGLPELVAQDLADYEALALALATEPARLAALKEKLDATRAACPLFDPADLARAMESAYRAMWHRYESALTPATLQL